MRLARLSVLCLIFFITSHSAQRLESGSVSELTIRLYDYADTRPTTLDRARREAARVLLSAGIKVRWEQCRTSESDTNRDASCTQRAGAHVIQLRVHPRTMARKLTKRITEFGYSIPLENNLGIIAGVYLDRTSEIAQSQGLDLHVVLGHTIAHEVGHLLLGTDSHANTGIMRSTWRDREVRLAVTGLLGFTEDQAEAMRTQVVLRIRAASRRPVVSGQIQPEAEQSLPAPAGEWRQP